MAFLPALEPASTLRRVAQEIRPHRTRIAGLLGLDLLSVPLLLLAPVPLKIAVDSVVGSKPLPGYVDAVVPDWLTRSPGRLLLLAAGLQVFVVVLAALQEMASYITRTVVGERITLLFRTRLFRHVQRLSILFHDARGTTDSIFRVQYDAPAIQWVTIDGLLPLVQSVVALVATLWVIAALDWQLALVALLVTPLLFALTRAYNKRMRSRYKDVRGVESSAMHVVQEVLTALRVVKAFGREDYEEERFRGESVASSRGRVGLAKFEGLFGLLVSLTTAVGTAGVLYLGVRAVQSNRLTLGELLMVVAYLAQLYGPLRAISQTTATVQASLAGAERAFELLDELPEVPERLDALPIDRARGRVELRGVSFGYEPERTVLTDLSIVLEPGTKLGIAGRTGAGKTTLVSLLTRFFDPTEGQIFLDGVDLRDYRVADLRNQFSIVPQEPVLFSSSIAENIAYARPDASMDEVMAAARAANADQFVQKLSTGYDTMVGERGMSLSGGERQRIALARAFLKDAPILVLDEPTSSVDVRTESAIMDAMSRLMEGRTTVMIAHRLSTLDVCDLQIEIADGKITSFVTRAERVHPRRRSTDTLHDPTLDAGAAPMLSGLG